MKRQTLELDNDFAYNNRQGLERLKTPQRLAPHFASETIPELKPLFQTRRVLKCIISLLSL